jgi:hypothetical protein
LPRWSGWLIALGAASHLFPLFRLRRGWRIRLLLAIMLLADTVFFSHLSLHKYRAAVSCFCCKHEADDDLGMSPITTRRLGG